MLNTPPNILISTEDENEFKKYKSFLQSLLGRCSYTIYRLNTHDLTSNSIWIPSCALLIISETFNDNYLDEKIKSYKSFLEQGGNILSLPSINENNDRVNKKIQQSYEITIHENKFCFESRYENNFQIIRTNWNEYANKNLNDLFYLFKFKDDTSSGFHFVSKLFIESEDEMSNSFVKEVYLKLFMNFFKLRKSDSFISDNFEVYEIYSKNQSTNVIQSYLADSMNKSSKFSHKNESENFNPKLYYEHLKTKKIGLIILYSDLVGSTMDSLINLPNTLESILVLARQQTDGQGNNKNEWLSPIGCCMFTLYLNLNTNTFSPTRLCLLQFASALACVKAIDQTPGHEDLPIKIKWPNDIYYDGKRKLGGVLVKSSIMGSSLNVKIGIGFNLSNEYPTECLNRILREKKLPEWQAEIFSAKFLNYLEYYVNLLANSNTQESLNRFLDDFQTNWLHKDQKVYVNFWNEEVDIIGLNEFGYLKVKKQDGSVHCLQPDGNRFDLMQNMIVLR